MRSPARRIAAVFGAVLCARVLPAAFGIGGDGAVFDFLSNARAAEAATSVEAQPAPTTATGDFLALQRRYQDLYQQARKAVVKVNADVPGLAEGNGATTFVWTGFFISPDGYILTTNAHLLETATRVWIVQGGVPYIAEVKGLDPVTNIALLRAAKLPKDLSVIDLGETPELPQIGTLLLAVAYKLEFQDPSPAPGIIEGDNINYGKQTFATLHLRTNIEDEGGEGGCPVFDLDGRLAGIMVASLPDARSTLILPTRAILRVREDLVNHGRALYARFGFDINQVSDAQAGTRVIISSVDYDGPAQHAGLLANDQLLSFNNVPIQSDTDLRQAFFFAHPGQYVSVHVNRGGKEIEVQLQASEMMLAPSMPTSSAQNSGVAVQGGSVAGNASDVVGGAGASVADPASASGGQPYDPPAPPQGIINPKK